MKTQREGILGELELIRRGRRLIDSRSSGEVGTSVGLDTAAELLSMPVGCVKRLVRAGELRAERDGRDLMIPLSEIIRFKVASNVPLATGWRKKPDGLRWGRP